MRETARHVEAYNHYFILRQEGKSVTDAVNDVASKYDVTDTSVYRWMKAFDWKGREAIQTHDIQVQVAEKTNEALSDNKAWYLKTLHEKMREADDHNTVHIESMADYERAAKLALLIQGDDKHDTSETNILLKGILEAIREGPGRINTIGVKSSFDDKSK